MRPPPSLSYLLWLVALSLFAVYVSLRLLLPLVGVPVIDIV